MKPNLGRMVAQTMSKAAEGRTIEVITGELLEAKQAGGEAILTIGRCLSRRRKACHMASGFHGSMSGQSFLRERRNASCD